MFGLTQYEPTVHEEDTFFRTRRRVRDGETRVGQLEQDVLRFFPVVTPRPPRVCNGSVQNFNKR